MKPAAILFAVAAIAGLLAPRPAAVAPPQWDGYAVLTGDFHLHMFPLDDSTLSPWDVVLEARRRGLDVIALTGHNQVWTAKIGRWFSRFGSRPMVLVGEEIITPAYDMVAVGIDHSITWRGSAAESVAAIHRQGGIAIAAHPLRVYWPAYDDAAMRDLDGAEVLHPLAFSGPEYATQLREFYQRKPLAAVGSSDFHATGYPGFSRTYVFVREVSERGVLDALREHHTVAVDRDGRPYGDPELIRIAEGHGGLPPSGVPAPASVWQELSRWGALAGMAALIAARR